MPKSIKIQMSRIVAVCYRVCVVARHLFSCVACAQSGVGWQRTSEECEDIYRDAVGMSVISGSLDQRNDRKCH